MKGCVECGGKPASKPTPRVLEIVNNRENTTIFHKVPYPASLGVPTDEEVKALQYSNVLLVIEANNDAWLFSSDGVPTLLTRGDWQLLQDRVDQFDEEVQEVIRKTNEALSLAEEASEFAHAESKALRDITGALQRNLEQEVSDRTEAINDLKQQVEGELTGAVDTLQKDLEAETANRVEGQDNLQSQIDAINDKSDVVDVVGTKAELDAYDTSALGDNDVVKVLNDESHDGAITYYRWDKASSTWEYIGETGPYYTKSEVDEKIAENTPDVPERAKNLPQYIPFGASNTGDSVMSTWNYSSDAATPQMNIKNLDNSGTSYTTALQVSAKLNAATSGKAGLMSAADKAKLDSIPEGGGELKPAEQYPVRWNRFAFLTQTADAVQFNARLYDTDKTTYLNNPSLLAATQEHAGAMSAEDKRNLDALVEGGGGSVTLAEEYGNSSDVALSQKFLSEKLNSSKINIGSSANASGGNSIALFGKAAVGSIAIGAASQASGISVAIGGDNTATNSESVALGHGTRTSRAREVSIGHGEGAGSATPATRYLANVTAGELPTDAVNLQQMQDYVAEHGGGGGTLYSEYCTNEDGALTQKFVSDKLNGEGIVLGNEATAAASATNSSVVIGSGASIKGAVTNPTGVVIGKGATTLFGNSVVIGGEADASSNSYAQVVIGDRAKGTTNPNGRDVVIGPSASGGSGHLNVVIGHKAQSSSYTGTVVLGASSKAGRGYEVSVGGGTGDYATRYLANVKDGELPQDAVTVNQLNTAIGDVEAILARLSDGAGV